MSHFDDLKGVWLPHKGVPISEADRNSWGVETAEFLLEDENEWVTYTRSGDSIVIAIREHDGKGIEIFDCQIRRKLRF